MRLRAARGRAVGEKVLVGRFEEKRDKIKRRERVERRRRRRAEKKMSQVFSRYRIDVSQSPFRSPIARSNRELRQGTVEHSNAPDAPPTSSPPGRAAARRSPCSRRRRQTPAPTTKKARMRRAPARPTREILRRQRGRRQKSALRRGCCGQRPRKREPWTWPRPHGRQRQSTASTPTPTAAATRRPSKERSRRALRTHFREPQRA